MGNALGVGGLVYWTCLEMNFIGDNGGFGDWDSEWMKLTELWNKLPTVAACESPISPSVIGHPPEMLQKFWHNF